MYLDYPAFRTDVPNSDKCQDTKLFIPVINKHVDFKHLICHGCPIIIRTDEPSEKFTDKILIYIVNISEIIIIEKIHEGKHKLLKLFYTSGYDIHVIDELLRLPSPQSTFDKNIIKERMGEAKSISHYE